MPEKNDPTAMDDRTAPMPAGARSASSSAVAEEPEATVNREPREESSAREGSAVLAAADLPPSGSFDAEIEGRRGPPARPAVGYTATFAAPAVLPSAAERVPVVAVPSAPAPVDVFASRASFAGDDEGADAAAPSILAPPAGVAARPAQAAPPATEAQLEQVVTAPIALGALTALRAQAVPTEPQGTALHHTTTEERIVAPPRSTDPWLPALPLPLDPEATQVGAGTAVSGVGAAAAPALALEDAQTLPPGAPSIEGAAPPPLPTTLPLDLALARDAAAAVDDASPLVTLELPAAAPAVSADGPTRLRTTPPVPRKRSAAPVAIAVLLACAVVGVLAVRALLPRQATVPAPPPAAHAVTAAPSPPTTPAPIAPVAPSPPSAPAAVASVATSSPPAPPAPPPLAPIPTSTPPVAVATPPPTSAAPAQTEPQATAARDRPLRASDGFGPFLDRSGAAPGLGRALGEGVRAALGDALAGTAVGVRGEVRAARVKGGLASADCALVVFDARGQRASIRGSASVAAGSDAAATLLPRAAAACARAVEGELAAAVAHAKRAP